MAAPAFRYCPELAGNDRLKSDWKAHDTATARSDAVKIVGRFKDVDGSGTSVTSESKRIFARPHFFHQSTSDELFDDDSQANETLFDAQIQVQYTTESQRTLVMGNATLARGKTVVKRTAAVMGVPESVAFVGLVIDSLGKGGDLLGCRCTDWRCKQMANGCMSLNVFMDP